MNRTARILGVAAWLLPFLLYLATLCPTVHLGDSGELNLAAATLGIPHVPGYPLLSTLAHAACRLPFGNAAMRGNLFSALCGALACWLLYRFLLWRFHRPALAFALAMCLAGSFTLWEQSLKIRAYPLNTCFAVAAIFLTMRWRASRDRRTLFSLGLLFGLGLANHEILLVAAPVPLAAMAADIRKLKMRDVLFACGLGLLGLTVYAYLPIRAMTGPVLNWGDPRTLPQFLDVILQRQYAGKMLSADWGPRLVMTGLILKSFITELGPVVAVIGLCGLVVVARSDRVLLAGLVLLVLLNIVLRVNYIGEQEFHQVSRYIITSLAAFLILAAFAADRLLEGIERSSLSAFHGRALSALLLLLIAVPPLLIHGQKNDLSKGRIGYDYIIGTLSFPETGYALAVGGDNDVFPLWYLQRFERFREDVVVLPRQGFRAKWLADEIAGRLPEHMTEPRTRYLDLGPDVRFFSTLDRLIQDRWPVYSLFDTTSDPEGGAAMEDLTERFGLAPCGIALRFGPSPSHCDPQSPLWDLYAFDTMTDPDLYRDAHTIDILENASVMLTRRGLALDDRGKFKEAIGSFTTAGRIMPDDPAPLMNLANTLARAGFPEKALALYDQLLDRYPDNDVFRRNRDLIAGVISKKEAP